MFQFEQFPASPADIYREYPDYIDAQQGAGPIFIGRKVDIKALQPPPGSFLNPEGRSDEWSYTANQAFIAGGMKAGRTFILVTTLTTNENLNALKFGYTGDELAWLYENKYHPVVTNENQITFHPTAETNTLIEKSKLTIKNFRL